jgi:hypothetical protein
LDEETLNDLVQHKLSIKLSIDQNQVSINALELFTRQKGLKQAMIDILEQIVGEYKIQNKVQLNQEIVSELSEVKQMLDIKSQQLNKQ